MALDRTGYDLSAGIHFAAGIKGQEAGTFKDPGDEPGWEILVSFKVRPFDPGLPEPPRERELRLKGQILPTDNPVGYPIKQKTAYAVAPSSLYEKNGVDVADLAPGDRLIMSLHLKHQDQPGGARQSVSVGAGYSG